MVVVTHNKPQAKMTNNDKRDTIELTIMLALSDSSSLSSSPPSDSSSSSSSSSGKVTLTSTAASGEATALVTANLAEAPISTSYPDHAQSLFKSPSATVRSVAASPLKLSMAGTWKSESHQKVRTSA